MLAIRLQRRGRKGHAQYRVVVQDKDLSPTSGRVVYNLGPYNPHTKTATLDSDKAKFYLDNGAQPSNTVAKLLKKEGIKLPKWVEIDTSFKGKLKDAEKLRKNRPDEPAEEAPATEDAAEGPATEESEEKADESAEEPQTEKPTEEKTDDSPADEKAEEKSEDNNEAQEESKDEAKEEPTEEKAE